MQDSLIDQFQGVDGQFSGNYMIEGVDHKLNLLLYGPPGTGKSRFIMTLAKYLNRSVRVHTYSQQTSRFQC